MKYQPSILLCTILGGLPLALDAGFAPASAAETLPGPYPAEILRIIDGDTVEARIRVLLGQDVTRPGLTAKKHV